MDRNQRSHCSVPLKYASKFHSNNKQKVYCVVDSKKQSDIFKENRKFISLT